MQLRVQCAARPDDGVLGIPVTDREDAAARALVQLLAVVAAVLVQVEDGAPVQRLLKVIFLISQSSLAFFDLLLGTRRDVHCDSARARPTMSANKRMDLIIFE